MADGAGLVHIGSCSVRARMSSLRMTLGVVQLVRKPRDSTRAQFLGTI